MKCGTSSGYAKHLRLKEPTCQPCRDAYAAKRREYYAKNPERIYSINRRWAARNPEKVKGFSRRIFSKRKSLKLQNGHQPYTEQNVLDLYGKVCHICSTEVDLNATRTCGAEGWEMGLHIDHLIPLSKGGSDTLENVRPSHAVCNVRKGNRG